MDKPTSSAVPSRSRIAAGNKNSGNWSQPNRPFLSIEGQMAMEYNIRMSKIKEEVQFKSSLVWSRRVRQWLEASFDVRMLDYTGSTIYLISSASYIPENIHVYRNNTVCLSNSLYMFMVTNSSFGKSDFHKRYKHAISNCYQVKMTGEMLPRPNTNDAEVSNALKCPYFIDDFTKLGLLNGLVNYPQLILADEADPFLIRNGLIPPPTLPSNGGNDNFNINDIALQAYTGEWCVLKITATDSIHIKCKRLCILGYCTSESTMRLMRRKNNYEQPSPFVERCNFFWVPMPLTLEKFEQPQWPYSEPTEDQICMALDILSNIDFYFDDHSRQLIISFGNALMFHVYSNQNGDQWINNRLGKSREHTYRVAANIQLVELAFNLLDQYYLEHNHYNHHKADNLFRVQMVEIANRMLNRTDLSQRIALDIHFQVVQSAINTVLMNISQYECFFSGYGLTRVNSNISYNSNSSINTNNLNPIMEPSSSSKNAQKQHNMIDDEPNPPSSSDDMGNPRENNDIPSITISTANVDVIQRKRHTTHSLDSYEEENSEISENEDYTHFLTKKDDEHISTVVSSKSNINPNISINDDSDEIIHASEDINEEQFDDDIDQFVMTNQKYSSIDNQASSHHMINHGSSSPSTNTQRSSSISSIMPFASRQELMVGQQSQQINPNSLLLATVDAQSMSANICRQQSLLLPNETTEQIQAGETWNPYLLKKFEEFMAMQRAHRGTQLSPSFDSTTVGHNHSVTAMIAPPVQLPSDTDLLKQTRQQTPASLAATRLDQRANNQKKEAKKQLLLASNAIEH
ncbi:unnamed protein product [Rotaria socialis]|uniref:Uncharacterized protein n=1 Tax=Rotaria socialis TaxID=392032 RepID=A0A817ZS34_9BILA|nr:unnamed protein product [Rotaria socialis]